MQYEALPNESGGIFLNIGRQDGFEPFQIHLVCVCPHRMQDSEYSSNGYNWYDIPCF